MFEQVQIAALTYAALFPVVNPLSGSMIFLNLTQGLPDFMLANLAKKIGINAFILLASVLLVGSWILRFFGISIPIVQIAGGLVVAAVAWKALNQPLPTTEDEEKKLPSNDKTVSEMAFFPLTMPLTAGPGAIAVVLTISAHEIHRKVIDTLIGQSAVLGGIIFMCVTIWITYRYADPITKKVGDSGKRVIMRLAAFINLCIGFQIMWNGIQNLLSNVL